MIVLLNVNIKKLQMTKVENKQKNMNKNSTEEAIELTNNHIKRCPSSLVIGEIEIKITTNTSTHALECLKLKKMQYQMLMRM